MALCKYFFFNFNGLYVDFGEKDDRCAHVDLKKNRTCAVVRGIHLSETGAIYFVKL